MWLNMADMQFTTGRQFTVCSQSAPVGDECDGMTGLSLWSAGTHTRI